MPYHIVKAKGGFQVVCIGRNGRVLSTSEILKSKASAWGNVESQVNEIELDSYEHECYAYVQDDTLANPVVWEVGDFARSIVDDKKYPVYIPGKNPKKKK